MSTVIQYPHLTMHSDGTVRIGNTRYKVLHLAGEHHYQAWSADDLLRNHPDLRPEQVYAALTYFYDHRDEMIAELEAEDAASRDAWSPPPVTRAELERRRAARGL